MKITPKQEKFVDYYIQTANATEAAKLAGYSAKTTYSIGNENLNKPVIKKAIDERLGNLKNERTAETKEVLENLTSVIRGNATEEILLSVKGDIRRLTKTPSIRDRLRAIELLCKINGWFKDSSQINLTALAPVILRDDVNE